MRRLPVRGCRLRAGRRQAGRGFYQLMDGIEVGRVNVAARGCGVAHRAFELAVSYARSRRSFGKIIGEHQAISFKLAEMATKTVAAHQMMVLAARRKDEGGQTDVEAGTDWLLRQPEVRQVQAHTLTDNVPSRRVLEKAGFRYLGLDEGEALYQRT